MIWMGEEYLFLLLLKKKEDYYKISKILEKVFTSLENLEADLEL